MEGLANNILDNRGIGLTTLKNYMRIYKRLLKWTEQTDVRSLFKSPACLARIKTSRIASQPCELSAVIVAMESLQKYNSTLDYNNELKEYRQYMMSLLPAIAADKYLQVKTQTQEDNWLLWSELQKCIKVNRKAVLKLNKRTDLNQDEINTIQQWIISALYCSGDLNPPRRLDYKSIKIISSKLVDKGEYRKDQNYLVVQNSKTKYFLYQNYKTVKTFGALSVPVGPDLNKVLQEWIRIRKANNITGDELLTNTKGDAIGDQLNVHIGKAFDSTGKAVTVNLIRHIYLSENSDDWTLEKRKGQSRLMSHSLETALTYSKVYSASPSPPPSPMKSEE